MITQDLFESVDLARGVDNVKALLRAVARSTDAEVMLGNEPVTITYPEARFMAGKFRAFQRAGRATEFYRDMADPVAFDEHMRQLRQLIDRQRDFRSTAKEIEPMAEKKSLDIDTANARLDRMLKQLRARNPQANNDLEALIYDYRTSQQRDRRDIERLDIENDNEDELIDRLQRELDRLKGMRGISESLRPGEYHLVTVTLDDGTVEKVKIRWDEGFRDQLKKQFARQGKTIKDIEVDWSVRSDLQEKKDACYHKVRSRYKVWPSAYASGALVQCRKKGAANWGNKSK